MAPSKGSRTNPFAFTRWPVTILTAVVYITFIVAALVVHHAVPPAPSSPTPAPGLNLTEAWTDLQLLTNGFRPYNSRKNDLVREWLLRRVRDIVSPTETEGTEAGEKPEVTIFDDLVSNLTFAGNYDGSSSMGVYFEGTNILVYVRGTDDEPGPWWEKPNNHALSSSGVLVNAHYDSVSTGYGATDDGVGVVTCLQLLRYFSRAEHAPRRGLVVLFNNGEEDFLNGARVYSQHPVSRFAHTFLNLEGAGAGGRATLFRSSDADVTEAYGHAAHPFGSVLSANGFDTGLIRSQTDYVVFEGDMGLRGLDVAFMAPRARYHTDQDDARHTSLDSVWHMLSAAVATTQSLVSDTSARFDGLPQGKGKVASGKGPNGVWFDLFGKTLVVFRVHTLFAISVTLLIVAPLTLLATSIVLANADRMYLFRSQQVDERGGTVSLQGVRGFFRFPFVFGIPTAVAVGLAYMLTKVNPHIAHSSPYAVWAMIVSAWLFLAWFVARVADFARPSALHRVYTLTWLFVLAWAMLVVATVYENERHLAGGYFVFFHFCGVFLATWIAYLELFALPRKFEFVNRFVTLVPPRPPPSPWSWSGSRQGTGTLDNGDDEAAPALAVGDRDTDGHSHSHGYADNEATESTSLLHRGRGQRTSFANYRAVSLDAGLSADGDEPALTSTTYNNEQPWSSHLPQWTWILQVLLTAPVVLVIAGPLALLLTSALNQTTQDGGSPLFIYICIAALTAFLFSPLLPFIHRLSRHLPILLFCVCVATTIYNLVAFPFSESNRLKLFFLQEIDLSPSTSSVPVPVNRASLTGLPPYVHDVVTALPSAQGQDISCAPSGDRVKCSWIGLDPHVVQPDQPDQPDDPTTWLSYNVTSTPGPGPGPSSSSSSTPGSGPGSGLGVRFEISAQNSRACRLVFSSPVPSFHVHGSAYDPRFPHTYPSSHAGTGTREIRLWSRSWDRAWTVDVGVPAGTGTAADLTGRVVCLWSDQNNQGTIPALDEVRRYAPVWAGVSKLGDGLVEASKAFDLSVFVSASASGFVPGFGSGSGSGST